MFPRSRRAALATVWLLALAATAAAQQGPQRVLLLYEERPDLPGLAALDAEFVRTLGAARPGAVEVYREAMDLSRFGARAYAAVFRDYLRAKYADKRIDVVVAVMGPALDFMLAHGSTVFPGAPVVFCGLDRRDLAERKLPPNATAVLFRPDVARTLALALQLHPGTGRVVYVGGSAPFDRRITEQAREQIAAARGAPRVQWLEGLPLRALLDSVAALPPHTVVLLGSMLADTTGGTYVAREAAAQLAAASRAPVYTFVDQYMGRGVVGGRLYSIARQGGEAARLTLKLLAGATVAALPPSEPRMSVDEFDGRALRRWRVNEKRLPAGAVVRYVEETPWERYRAEILVALTVLVIETALIGTLLVERRVRRRAQRALRTSEMRTQLAGASLGVGFWSWESEQDHVWLSEPCARLLGIDANAPLSFVRFLEVVRPRGGGTRDLAFERALRGGMPFDGEWTVASPDGGTRWIAGAMRTSVCPTSGRRRVHGALIDVTERHAAEALAEEQRRELAHLGRVAVMGELSGTLAHELNQPLAAILVNARAAQRLLERDPLQMVELHAILDDIVADDKRAGAVIHHVRALVRKGESGGEPQLLSLNDLVREVLELAHGDLVSRGVTVQTRLASVPPLVSADRVQLQQVLLNLLMNACDAMAGVAPGERRVAIMTGATETMARLEVRDRGPGFPAELLAAAFEPFVTTKRQGVGLGLAICRSIVSAHGGELHAKNAADCGASLVLTLPLAGEGAFSAVSWNSSEWRVVES